MRLRAVLAVIVLALTSCTTSSHTPYSEISDVAESPSDHLLHVAGRAGEVTQQDRDFVYRATVECLYNLSLATIAKVRATSPSVRDFARRVTNECREQNWQLELIAEQHVGATPPSKLHQDHTEMRDQVRELAGETFDRAYVKDQISASKRALGLFVVQSESGSEPILRSFAAAALPTLRQRERSVQEVRSQLSN
jgi:putative membrane protein